MGCSLIRKAQVRSPAPPVCIFKSPWVGRLESYYIAYIRLWIHKVLSRIDSSLGVFMGFVDKERNRKGCVLKIKALRDFIIKVFHCSTSIATKISKQYLQQQLPQSGESSAHYFLKKDWMIL